MKAKTIGNSPYGFDTCIYDNEDYPMGYYVDDLPNKERADKYTNIFNSELSAHVAKETAPLLAEIDRLKREVERVKNKPCEHPFSSVHTTCFGEINTCLRCGKKL